MSETSKFYDVPAGKIAAVVTYLEMRSPPPTGEERADSRVELRRIENPDPDWYLKLFNEIGEDLLWFGRLTIDGEDLFSILSDPNYEVYVVRADGEDAGLLELDFRTQEECELS